MTRTPTRCCACTKTGSAICARSTNRCTARRCTPARSRSPPTACRARSPSGTPDGRLAGTTYSDGSMSAYPGTDRNGPYACSTRPPAGITTKSQNSQLNFKIHPTASNGLEGSRKLVDLTRAYMRKGAYHIQYNVVDSKVSEGRSGEPRELPRAAGPRGRLHPVLGRAGQAHPGRSDLAHRVRADLTARTHKITDTIRSFS
jgi:hypothetical protein